MNKCFFCGAETNGKTFDAKDETGETRTHPVCDDCDDTDLHKTDG